MGYQNNSIYLGTFNRDPTPLPHTPYLLLLSPRSWATKRGCGTTSGGRARKIKDRGRGRGVAGGEGGGDEGSGGEGGGGEGGGGEGGGGEGCGGGWRRGGRQWRRGWWWRRGGEAGGGEVGDGAEGGGGGEGW